MMFELCLPAPPLSSPSSSGSRRGVGKEVSLLRLIQNPLVPNLLVGKHQGSNWQECALYWRVRKPHCSWPGGKALKERRSDQKSPWTSHRQASLPAFGGEIAQDLKTDPHFQTIGAPPEARPIWWAFWKTLTRVLSTSNALTFVPQDVQLACHGREERADEESTMMENISFLKKKSSSCW